MNRIQVTLAALVVVALATSANSLPAGDSDPILSSPHAKLSAVAPESVRWTKGFWADRFQLCREVIVPEMKKALEHPNNSARLSNFRVGAGLEKGTHKGVNWSDGDCYKWLEAQAWLYTVTKDTGLDREMDYWIDLIAQTQSEDGYICTQTQLNPDKERWGQRSYHELYNMGHLMTAACVHHKATGKDTFVAVARNLADYLYDLFQPRPKELGAFGWNPSNIMGLVELYRVTSEKRYLELAGIFVDMRGSVKWPHSMWGLTPRIIDQHPGDQNQNRVPLRKETIATGHAVTAAYLWCGAADVYAETGEKALLDALKRIWADVVHKKMYITGGIGAYHHGVSTRYDLVHEAFGREYELPHRDAYNETCANIGNGMWNRRMLMLTGDARYGDVMERVIYNGGLSPMSIDGKSFCYCNPLARQHGTPLLSHDTLHRWVIQTCYCCPPNVARTLAKLHSWVYATSPGALWVNLYGGTELDTDLPGAGRVKLTQETDYPWSGQITIRIDAAPKKPLALRVRIPGWTDGATLRLNGKAMNLDTRPGAYAAVKRIWSAADVLELELAMEPTLMTGHPLVETARGMVAVTRGPLVYCLESNDLPEGVSVADVRVPRRSKWTTRHDPDLLDGVTVLEADALAQADPAEWTGLFRPLPAEEPRPIRLRLIPYYAWNNRGEPEMSVWLPLD